jgi:serine/threonine protein phosphatase PrpC
MKYTIVQESRVGARDYNQDRVGHWETGESLCMVLADGMGGHEHGDIAAQIVVDFMGEQFRTEAKPRLANPELFLFRNVGRLHTKVIREVQERGVNGTPSTTVVACIVQDSQAWWSFVGDSRLYMFRRGSIYKRTRDHTIVQLLIDSGRIREEAAATHPERNKLLQCIGGAQPPKLDATANARLRKDDILLLCSDGLWGPLTQRQLLMGLLEKELSSAIPALISLAEERAGSHCDNVSVLAMQWLEDTEDPTERTLPLGQTAEDLQRGDSPAGNG